MNVLPVCILYTQDADLAKRFKGYLYSLAAIRWVENGSKLETVLQQFDPALLFMDLRGAKCRSLLPLILRDLPDTLVIALGMPRSDPAMEAQALGAYAVEDVDITRQRLHFLVARAQSHLDLVNENRLLKQRAQERSHGKAGPVESPVASRPRPATVSMPLHHFSRAFRNFDKVEAMLESIAEGVASCVKVSRVGVFSVGRGGDMYCLRAGVKCLEDTRELEVPDGAPLIRWMQINAHVISRATLTHVVDPSERLLLEQSLDTLGAEVIIPLHGRERLLGWLFLGHRVTGIPFSATDLEELTVLAEHVSITLENALLHEEITVQKTLAETVLHSIPVGIVAVSDEGTVRWFNRAAEAILDVRAEDAMNRPAGNLASRIAGLLARCVRDGPSEAPVEWVDQSTQRSLSVSTRRLETDHTCLGAVAIIIDMTHEKRLRDKQSEIERAAFWTELAAAMSHAVRNPLVAISTFAQLLPERYDDPEFREQFSELVSGEIGRLDGMIDQLSAFAHPAPLQFEPLRLAPLLTKAIENAEKASQTGAAHVEFLVDEKLPYVEGDKDALTNCFALLITNALEAVNQSKYPSIHVTAGVNENTDGTHCVVNVQDNGRGIPPDILENVFSPLCTMKVRGIGLGLPIVRRTVEDHHGVVTIDTSTRGTNVTVSLPALAPDYNAIERDNAVPEAAGSLELKT